MKIAFIGDRGIPARYSGFSTLVEEVATGLSQDNGFDVTVYCRSAYFSERPAVYRGVHCIYLPAPGGKNFESIIHSSLAIMHAVFRRFDLVFIVDPGNAPFALPLVLGRVPVVFHTDGLGWKRLKWNRLQRRYYKACEALTARLGTWLVTDSRAMQAYYRAEYDRSSSYIPYGSMAGSPPDGMVLSRYSLQKRGYNLVVARMEPENNVELILREYLDSGLQRPLLVVGGARYDSEYYRRVLSLDGGPIRCLGSIYQSETLNALYQNCRLYIHGHEVGGTNPSLLRAMGLGAACLPLNVAFHREVLGDEAEYFDPIRGSLARQLRHLDHDEARIRVLGTLAFHRAVTFYRWDAVSDAYAALFRAVLRATRDAVPCNHAVVGDVYRPEAFAHAGSESKRWDGAPEVSTEMFPKETGK